MSPPDGTEAEDGAAQRGSPASAGAPVLFDPARHEPLRGGAWDPQRAHDAIRRIVADVEDARRDNATWPAHPRDDLAPTAAGEQSFYLGAAGVSWALWHLAREGAVALRTDPCADVAGTYRRYLAHPDTQAVVPSYFLGETGILLVQYRLTGAQDAADRLYAAVERNVENPTNEALWAAPGTMVPAWHMWRWTHEARWRELFLANVERLFRTWHRSEHAPCHLWTQDLRGSVVQLLGAGHGFAGNAYPLLAGAALLGDDRRELLYHRCAETLRVTAAHDGDAANWRPGVGPDRPGRSQTLVQWCHGAPGIVTSTAGCPRGRDPAFDALLVAAGNAVWRAGPLAKGAGLCHGTAGNGYAVLALHRRTGDATWLARARAFAMHAIAQCDAMRAEHGRGRYTLWTGDPGVAVYAWHCLQGAGGLPGLDVV